MSVSIAEPQVGSKNLNMYFTQFIVLHFWFSSCVFLHFIIFIISSFAHYYLINYANECLFLTHIDVSCL